MLTPMDIHDHQFKKSFRGYSENEVDDFLDKIVVDFEKLLKEVERLKTQLYANEKELDKYRELEKTMNNTLMMAQRTADDVISAARKNTDDMKENAARECQQIKEQAQYEAKQLIDAANVKRDAVLADYSKLVGEKNSFLLKMRMMLESELTITNHVIDTLPKVAEAVKEVLPEEKPKPVVEEVAKPVEAPKPVVEQPKPEEKAEPPIEGDVEINIVNVSTKPVSDDTKTYKPVKPSLDKEAAAK